MLELITGGSGSGKSEYAECRAVELARGAPLIYLAAMKPYGDEGHKRIERHRRLREGKGFVTIEKYTDFGLVTLPAGATVLFECLSNALANEMFDVGGAYAERIISGLTRLIGASESFVAVTNEVFSDGINYGGKTEEYKCALARLNRYLAAHADRVTEVVAGIPNTMKG